MARTRGWGGSPPADDAEARERIIESAMRCLDRYGPAKTGLADVATDLGVTRQTVYRYFSTTDDLLTAAALVASGAFAERMLTHLQGLTDPAEIIAEGIVWATDRLPHEPHLSYILQPAQMVTAADRIMDTSGLSVGQALLSQLPIDWAAYDLTDRDLEEYAEVILRVFVSYLHSPDTTRSREERVAFLARWVGGMIRVSDPAPPSATPVI